jgi:hypothetical protein
MAEDIWFDGVSRPLRLTDAAPVRALISEIAPRWPFTARPVDPDAHPFFRIEGAGARYLAVNQIEDKPARRQNAVNALCDMVAALAVALPASGEHLICLHAAALDFAGRLVVFPNVRRAGKSTLSAALAEAGHALFSDDVLPLFRDRAGRAHGVALGLAPRLRLPLPETLPHAFADWADAHAGPENTQYRYLSLPDQPAHGTALPIGAFVILDRQEDPVPARLEPVSPDAAMDALLYQNFTRDRHSGDVLATMAGLLAGVPVLRLIYARLADAVPALKADFASWPVPLPEPRDPATPFRMANLDAPFVFAAPPGTRLIQRPGARGEIIGGTLYLADPEGRGIRRMDPLAAAIWDLLHPGATAGELSATLAAAFPETDAGRIASDVDALLGRLGKAGLVKPA